MMEILCSNIFPNDFAYRRQILPPGGKIEFLRFGLVWVLGVSGGWANGTKMIHPLGSQKYVKTLGLVAKFGHQGPKPIWSHFEHVCPPGGQTKY